MIPYNYNVYGIVTEDFFSGTWDAPQPDTVSTGTLLETTTYYYFYEGQPLYSVDRDKLLDDSVYLWHLAPGSAAGTNSSYCIGVGDTLDLQISQNKAENVPLSMQLTNVTNRDFSRDPRARIAYNYFNYEMINIYDSKMFVDINRTTFCNYVLVHCYRKDNNSVSQQPLSNVANYINADPDNRYVTGVELQLYHGYTLPRNTYYTAVPAVSRKGFPAVDILTEFLIPDNATGVRKDLQYSFIGEENYHPDWVDDRIYAPYIMANRGIWYSGNQSDGNQFYIGGRTTRSVNELRNGYAQTGWSNMRVTGGFLKYSDKVQEFDDVVYKWVFKMYYINGGVFLENGFPLTSIPGADRIAIYSAIDIIDSKGANIGTALQRAVKHESAFLGFYFADTLDAAQNAVLGTANSHIYLPEFINGTTTGNYFTGDQIPEVPYANSTSVGDGNFSYDSAAAEGNEGDFSTQLQSGTLSAGTVYYALSDQELKDLLRFLNTTYNPDETTLAEDFKGANPFEYITSVKYYPFCLPYAVAQQINVGPISTGVAGYIMPYTYGNSSYSFFDMGSFTFTPRYNNFLDYAGTQINLYLPWCGTIQLDPAMWITSSAEQPVTLNIKYSFDYVTGAVTAFLFRDSMLIDTADGQVGIDIPMSALATGSYQQQIAQAQIAYKQAATSRFTAWLGLVGSVIGTAAAAASGVGAPAVIGGLAGIATSVNNLQKSEYQAESVSYTLDHTSPSVGSVSAASPFNAAIFDQRPRILISRPQLQQLPTNWQESYAKSVGYACSIPTKLNNAALNGLAVVQAPNLQGIKKTIGSDTFTPTKEELDLIRQAMAEGIIL